MNSLDKYSDRIDSYIHSRMTPEALRAFELEMDQSPELKEQVLLQKSFKESHSRRDVYEFSQKLKVISQNKKNPRSFSLNPYWSIAAMILVIFSVAIYITKSGSMSGNEIAQLSLNESYIEQYRSTSDLSIETKRNSLIRLIDDKDYTKFLEVSNQALGDEEFRSTYKNWTNLYQAYSLLVLDRVEEAELKLNSMVSPTNLEIQHRDYLQALVYLKNEHMDKARDILNNTQFDYPWDERAEYIMNKLAK